MRLIERQLQTTVNQLVKWYDQNGHTISPSKSSCVHFCRKRNLHPDPSIHIGNIQIPVVSQMRFLGVIFDCKLTFLPHVLYLRKKCERSLNILKVLSNTLWGAERLSLIRVYQARILSLLDCGCVVYGSSRTSLLKRLDTVHHSALRICSGAFRTLPVTSLYVVCHQPPLGLRRRQLSANYFIRAISVPSHPLHPFSLSIGLNRLYENYIHRVWQETWDPQVLNKLHSIHPSTSHWAALPVRRHDVRLSQLPIGHTRFTHRHLLVGENAPECPSCKVPYSVYHILIDCPVFNHHRITFCHTSGLTLSDLYGRYSAIYTDGSKRADYVSCGVVIEDIMHGYRLYTFCSVFTAEAVTIYRALQLFDSNRPRKYCIYTDSMSVLEALENYNDRCHPVVCTILDITSGLYSKSFDIVFCWLPSHVGIIGNEQADSAAKSATTHLPLAVPLLDMKRVILHHIFKIWQESWSQQLDNKLHSMKPVIGAWPVIPIRRTDIKLTRLRIGPTRFTHRHLLLGEGAPIWLLRHKPSHSLTHTTPDKLNSVSTENLPESVPNASNSEHSNAAEAQQFVKRKSRNRRKRPKVQKPDIEIKRVPHRSRNVAPTEITTDDEDMIIYDVEEEELEQDPPNKFTIDEDPFFLPKGYLRPLTPSRYRNYRE
ncbi:putative RNA-directed DNA polymerase from transposon X-element [Trichonephila clavipes]|nr:putative RNA-directed DNA polymerase from transposon X-element [Trichonephila clavipes]